MSVQLREIKRRIAGTGQIHKMTSTMQRIASTRMIKARGAAERSRRYTDRLNEVLKQIICSVKSRDHELLDPKRHGAECLVVFGSDRGLCGGFNSALIRRMEKHQKQNEATPKERIIISKIINRRAHHAQFNVRDSFTQPRISERAELINNLHEQVIGGFLDGTFRRVDILYTRFDSPTNQKPVFEQILPVPFRAGNAGPDSWVTFEPEPDKLLMRLLPEFVYQALDHAFLDSMISENIARQTAMARASENAGGILEELNRSYSSIRQENITTEMIEIISGRMQ